MTAGRCVLADTKLCGFAFLLRPQYLYRILVCFFAFWIGAEIRAERPAFLQTRGGAEHRRQLRGIRTERKTVLSLDMRRSWRQLPLLRRFPHIDNATGAAYTNDNMNILTETEASENAGETGGGYDGRGVQEVLRGVRTGGSLASALHALGVSGRGYLPADCVRVAEQLSPNRPIYGESTRAFSGADSKTVRQLYGLLKKSAKNPY